MACGPTGYVFVQKSKSKNSSNQKKKYILDRLYDFFSKNLRCLLIKILILENR